MIRTQKRYVTADGVEYVELSMDSNDNKPTGVAGGSKITESDTGKVYLYDEDSELWVEQFSLQSL